MWLLGNSGEMNNLASFVERNKQQTSQGAEFAALLGNYLVLNLQNPSQS